LIGPILSQGTPLPLLLVVGYSECLSFLTEQACRWDGAWDWAEWRRGCGGSCPSLSARAVQSHSSPVTSTYLIRPWY
jgi:hypothetical protein